MTGFGRKCGLCSAVLAAILVLGPQAALAPPGPPVDQNKLCWRADLGRHVLYFNDLDGDTWHDAAEPCSSWQESGYVLRPDYSCWMASTSNLIVYSGGANPYLWWLCNGACGSPNVSFWSNWFSSASADSFMTFDDGGWQDWALTFAGRPILGPIGTMPEFGGVVWVDVFGAAVNPITWCKSALDTLCIPVGLTCWWSPGSAPYSDVPGPIEEDLSWGYHAITLWDINVAAGTVTITDSDDLGIMGAVGNGPRTLQYAYAGGVWTIVALYPGVTATVNYAVAINTTGPSPTEENTWSTLKSLFR